MWSRKFFFLSFSQLSDALQNVESRWKHACNIYTFAILRFLLKNTWYHLFLSCETSTPMSWMGDGWDILWRSLKNKTLWCYSVLMLEYHFYWLFGYRTVPQAKRYDPRILICLDNQECFKGWFNMIARMIQHDSHVESNTINSFEEITKITFVF